MVAAVRKLLAAAAVAALLATTSAAPAARVESPLRARMAMRISSGGSDDRIVIVAAGDIACASAPNGPDAPEACQYDDTADLVRGGRLEAVLTLGDNQYETGAYADFSAYFDPTWGRARADLMPVPGNHEYAQDPTSRPHGYFRYFGDRVRGPRRLGFYSYDLGACPQAPCWHLIALNSELCFAPGGCGPAGSSDPGPGNRMYAWLRRDLAEHPDATYPCTLAYWHHPRFSFSTGSGATAAVGPLWDLLASASADLVLNGHSHNYQRWAPQDPTGAADPRRHPRVRRGHRRGEPLRHPRRHGAGQPRGGAGRRVRRAAAGARGRGLPLGVGLGGGTAGLRRPGRRDVRAG